MKFDLRLTVDKFKKSAIFKDSFWAVFGNGTGTGLLLIAGIIIARFLGKDLYGEYGVVKTNMFYLAGFSTFGLGLTSTRFIAKYLKEDSPRISAIIKQSTAITACFSSLIAVLLVVFAHPLATYLGQSEMSLAFKCLAVIVIIKALGTTGIGILSGLREFKIIARNLIVSGLSMLVLCLPLVHLWGLYGAFGALLVSQVLNTGMNYLSINKIRKKMHIPQGRYNPWELIKFSFPVAMQEISYSVCNWAGILALTKLSTMGEVGIYTAAGQWNAVILFLPGLLNNVVLSHLSRRDGATENKRKIKVTMSVYLCCTLVPFLVVFFLTPLIVSFYGQQFSGLGTVLRILVFSTIPLCCSDVFKSELLAAGHPWVLFSIRCFKDVAFLGLILLFLITFDGADGALYYSIANVIISTVFLLMLFGAYLYYNRRQPAEHPTHIDS